MTDNFDDDAQEQETKCPNCGKELKKNQKFCTNCGTKLEDFDSKSIEDNNKIEQQRKIIIILTVIIVSVFMILGILSWVRHDLDLEIPTPKESLFENKAKNCEDPDIKDLVMDIYKDNDHYYKFIDKSSIDSITLRSPVATEYDSTIDKYSCKGVIVIKGSQGLKPNKYDYSNDFYSLVRTYNYTNDNVPLIRKAIEIQCPVTYSSQISEGNSTVYSSYCGDNSIWDSQTKPEIVWDNYETYIEQPGERARIQKEKQEQEKLEEQRKQVELKREQEELKRQQQEEQKRKEDEDRYNNSSEGRYKNAQEDLF